MSNNNSILEQLKENNPFQSSSSPFPWDNMNPDLLQLSRDTSEEIEQLLRHKRRDPAMPLAGLILGEAGSGKTHMLTRILRRLRSNAKFAIFVAVRAFRDPEGAIQHLLSEIFISLKRIHSSGRTQFDILAGEVMNTYGERRHNDGFGSIEGIDMRTYLSRDMPNLDRNFLKCLLLYLGTHDESVKLDVLEWLEKGLDEEESLKLGLPFKDLSSMTEAKKESEAIKTLISLGLVLGYAKIPMLICFDQLDHIKAKDRELINALGNVISLLVNDLSGILPLCFMRAQIWNDVFLPVLDEAVVQRLRNNTMMMMNCTAAQARQLIHDRIVSAFPDNTEEIYKWLISKLDSSLKPGTSPRGVIELANHVINNERIDGTNDTVKAADSIFKAVKSAYEDECKKVQTEPNSWPPNSDQLTLALQVWLEAFDGIDFTSSKDKHMRLKGTYSGRRFSFVIVTAKNHVVASSGLKKGTTFLREFPGSLCCYITEEKTHKRTWKQANENLRIFQEAGGKSIFLDRDSRIKWYGLTALIDRIDNGDVNIYLPSSVSRIATREDIQPFLREIKLLDFKPASESGPKAPVALEDEKRKTELTRTLKAVIKSSPMNLLTVDKAVELLGKKKVSASRNEVLLFVSENSSIFRTFTSQNGDILITFTDSK